MAISNAKIIEALKKTHGNFALSARMLQCSRTTIWNRVNKSPELQKIVEEEREGVIDVAEGMLNQAVLKGEPWAITFTLKGIGKARGHNEKVENEITGKEGKPIEHKVVNLEEEVKRIVDVLCNAEP